MALVLHSGIYGHALHILTIFCSWHHTIQTMEVVWPYCMGFRTLQCTGSQRVQVPWSENLFFLHIYWCEYAYFEPLVLYRFVLPVLPIALMFSGYALAKMNASDSPNVEKKGSLNIHTRCPSKMQFFIFFLLATNIPMALYMSLIHQVHHFPCQWNKAGYLLLFPPSLQLLEIIPAL